MQHASENVEGYLRARDLMNDLVIERARRDYPGIVFREGTDSWSRVGMDYVYTRTVHRIPWYQWKICLGRIRPTGRNPITWFRYFLLVRAAKREINRTIHHRWGNSVRSLARH